MPNPMPLVEPVINDTLPASACWVLIFADLMAMFMARAFLVVTTIPIGVRVALSG
jgi:hypothetical protein